MSDGVKAGGNVKIRFTNKQSGKGASVDVHANGHNQGVKTSLEESADGKALIQVGTIDEVDLVGNFDKVTVPIRNKNTKVAQPTSSATSKQFSAISVDDLTVTATRS